MHGLAQLTYFGNKGLVSSGKPLFEMCFFTYDKGSPNTASSVPKTSKFQSGHRVVKMYIYI